MKTQSVNYKYKSTIYPLELKWDRFNYDDLVIDVEKVRGWCKEGCPNFNTNGGCPPYSLDATDLLYKKDFILLICKVKTTDISGQTADEKINSIERIHYKFMNELGYKIKDLYSVDFLTPSQCRGCNPCTIKTGCKAPQKRVYSITGTGIMLKPAIEDLFGETLQWFSKTEEPEHSINIMTFISEEKSSMLLDEIKEVISQFNCAE